MFLLWPEVLEISSVFLQTNLFWSPEVTDHCLIQFVELWILEFIANKRLKALGYDPLYDVSASQNPLPWTQHWLSSKGMQVAPQETEVESYIVGGIKQDVKKGQFSKFKL